MGAVFSLWGKYRFTGQCFSEAAAGQVCSPVFQPLMVKGVPLGVWFPEVHNNRIHLLHVQAEIIVLDTHDQVVHLTLYFVSSLLLMRLYHSCVSGKLDEECIIFKVLWMSMRYLFTHLHIIISL